MANVSILSELYARVVAAAEHRGNGTRGYGDVADILAEALEGDWYTSLDRARASRISASPLPVGQRTYKRIKVAISTNNIIVKKLRTLGIAERGRAIDRAINRALDAAGVP